MTGASAPAGQVTAVLVASISSSSTTVYAMGAGVCVLTSDIPENRELVEEAGFTFKHGEVNDLERMLRLLLSDPHVRQEAARNAGQRIRAHYLWPQITREIERAYLKLLDWEKIPGAHRLDSRTVVVEEKERVAS